MIAGNFALWFHFAKDLKFYSEQQPATCVDGRVMNETVSHSRIGVDDSKRNKNSVTMECSFPVAVYICLDEAIEPEEWNGQCKNLAQTPSYNDHEWPRRNEEVGVNCCAGNCMGGDKCDDKKWSCSNGACNAYEKSARLCASKLRSEPYKCFTVQGQPEEGVRDEASSFPAGWLAGALLCTILATLPCIVFTFVTLSKEEDCMKKTAAFMMMSVICFGIMAAVGFAINAAMDVEDSKGVVDHDYKDLAETTGSAVFGTNKTTVIAETPPPEGMHWAIILLIVFGAIYAVLCLCAGCYAMMNMDIPGFFITQKCSRKQEITADKTLNV